MTGDKENRYDINSDIGKFIEENLDILEDMIRREKDATENIYARGKERVRNHVEKTKRESQDSIRQIVDAMMDPEIQGHFMSSGFEFILGINALMRAMPQPEFMKGSKSEEEEEEEVAPKPKKSSSPRSIKIETPEEVPPPKKTTTRSKKKPATVKSEE